MPSNCHPSLHAQDDVCLLLTPTQPGQAIPSFPPTCSEAAPAPTPSAFLPLALLNYNPEYLPASCLSGLQLHGTQGSSSLRLHLSAETNITILVSELDASTTTDVLRWAGGFKAMHQLVQDQFPHPITELRPPLPLASFPLSFPPPPLPCRQLVLVQEPTYPIYSGCCMM